MQTVLPAVSILDGLSEAAITLLAKEAQRVVAEPGLRVISEGEPGEHLFLIESGSVRVCKRCGQPGETELDRLGPGEFFGEMCILETLPRSASVQAVNEAVVFRISSSAFYRLYQELPDQFAVLVLNIARDLSRRLRRIDDIFAARH